MKTIKLTKKEIEAFHQAVAEWYIATAGLKNKKVKNTYKQLNRIIKKVAL